MAFRLASLATHQALGVIARPLEAQRRQRVDGGLALGDALCGGIDQVERRDLALAEPANGLAGGETDEVVGHGRISCRDCGPIASRP